MKEYWEKNNGTLSWLTKWGKVGAWSGLGSAALSFVSTPILTSASAALLLLWFGVAVLDPEPISKALLVGGLIIAVAGLVMTYAGDDLQNVNNEIVRSGAYDKGGSITASWNKVTITPTGGTPAAVKTTIPFVAQLSLMNWASNNPSLVLNP